VQEERQTDSHTSITRVSPIIERASKLLPSTRKIQEAHAFLVQDVMTQDVVMASPEDTIENAARLMTKFGISCLVVQAGNQIVGILTEKDVLTRVVASGRDPKEVLVEEVMTNSIITTEPEKPIEAAVKTMIEEKIKKLPVVDGSAIVGIITLTDVAGLNPEIWRNEALKEEQPVDINALVESYESQHLEFKSSFRYSFHRKEVDPELEFNCLKAICAFLNASGGDLIIGVSDSNVVVGIERDYMAIKRRDRDGFQNYLINQIAHKIGNIHLKHIVITFHTVQEQEVCRVHVGASHEPAFLKHRGKELFFVRTGNGSRPLNISEAVSYLNEGWNR
jgi:CBS domain-containing protein